MIELNTIYNEDCLETMKRIPDGTIDLILTDPPYRIHAKSGGGLHNKRDWLKNVNEAGIDSFNPIDFLPEMERICKGFHAYIFCSKDLLPDYLNRFETQGYKWEILIYAKRNPIPTKNNKYLSDKEYCLFVRDGDCYFDNNQPFDDYRTVQYVNVVSAEYHPTQKSLSYINRLIQKSTKPGQTIYDPFMGSGTTALACKELGRNYIGSEISTEYCAIAESRLAQGVFDFEGLGMKGEE